MAFDGTLVDAEVGRDLLVQPTAQHVQQDLALARRQPCEAQQLLAPRHGQCRPMPETDLGKLALGMPAVITTDSFPGRRYRGWVGYISPTAEFTPKAVETPTLRTQLVYQVRGSV